MWLSLKLFFIASSTISSNGYCPVVICPGFGNDIVDYDTPLGQRKDVGLRACLERRGFDAKKIYTVPIQRPDWIRVAGGLLDIPDFYTCNAKPTGLGYGWYIDRLKKTVDLAFEESGGEKVILIGHSAGGWLARAAMGNGDWDHQSTEKKEDDDDVVGTVVKTSDRVRALATLGAIHKAPLDESTCVTRGALKYTDSTYPGAFLDGVCYVTVGGTAITGDENIPEDVESDRDEFYSKRGEGSASRVAFTSYEAVAGRGDLVGDGVVPIEWTQLEGAKNINLPGVLHSINEAGTTIPTDRWYGSEMVIDRWLDQLLLETSLTTGNGRALSTLDRLQDWATTLMSVQYRSSKIVGDKVEEINFF